MDIYVIPVYFDNIGNIIEISKVYVNIDTNIMIGYYFQLKTIYFLFNIWKILEHYTENLSIGKLLNCSMQDLLNTFNTTLQCQKNILYEDSNDVRRFIM